MLDVAVNFLTKEPNAYLLACTGATFGSALLSRIANDAGKWATRDDQGRPGVGRADTNIRQIALSN
jgi:hypothetical protein